MSWFGLLPSQRCAVCPATSGLLRCGGCKVISYCCRDHQSTHRSKHKVACTTIKNTREKLALEEAALRAEPPSFDMPDDVFNDGVGHFWGILGTRDYMRARFAAADALLKVKTVPAAEKALEHFTDMLRLCRSDNQGVRDMVPPLLLRLDREQECYDFLKWWATVDDKDHYNGQYDWGNTALPYLDTKGADVFEPVTWSWASLSHFATLTLLKLRLLLDLQAFEFNPFTEPDRPVGSLVKSKVRTFTRENISRTIKALKSQYHQLCQVVNKTNPYFWDVLLDEGEGAAAIPDLYTNGSREEAQLVSYWCKEAWQESEDALVMVEADTCSFVQVYTGPPAGARRGVDRTFPSKFEHTAANATPSACFAATPISGSQTVRFVANSDPKRLLVYTDGACANNGQSNPRGGWAIVYGPTDSESGRLEDIGRLGYDGSATSNRAELYAAIAALQVRDWKKEGFDSIVIATDSVYVVDGATAWAKKWVLNGWNTSDGCDVKNRDLWELLLGEVERWADLAFSVHFWKIPRELNREADQLAKAAANMAGASTQVTGGGSGDKPRILTLCLEYEDMFDGVYGSLVAQIKSKAALERATTPETALRILNGQSPPSIVLVTDGAITRQQKLWERLIDLMRAGSTVILCGCFSSMVTMGQFDRFFARLGLPWRRGSYSRETVKLRRQVVGNRKLPAAYSQKALFVAGVERSAVWYAQRETSDEAAVVFANVGAGKLGYVGDVNGEEGSVAVVLAMCGLLE